MVPFGLICSILDLGFQQRIETLFTSQPGLEAYQKLGALLRERYPGSRREAVPP
jgi:hypothetical protein